MNSVTQRCLQFTAWSICVAMVNMVQAQKADLKLNHEMIEKRVQIVRVQGDRIRVVETASRGRGRSQRGGSVRAGSQAGATQALPGQRRRGRGVQQSNLQARKANGSAVGGFTLLVPEDAMVTYAITERRTNEFKVGASINGGLRNPIFKSLPGDGLPARIVVQGGQLVEVNLIQANDTSLEDIAVKPKRPPSRRRK